MTTDILALNFALSYQLTLCQFISCHACFLYKNFEFLSICILKSRTKAYLKKKQQTEQNTLNIRKVRGMARILTKGLLTSVTTGASYVCDLI